MTAPSQIASRDYCGTRPCIPPHVLAEVCKRAARRSAESGRHAQELQKGLRGAARAHKTISPEEPAAPAATAGNWER